MIYTDLSCVFLKIFWNIPKNMTILLAIFQQCTGVHQEKLSFAFGFVWKTNAVSTHWFHEKNMVPYIWGQHGWPTYVNPENQKHFAHQGRNYTENITVTKTNDQSTQLCRNKVENTWAYCTWTPTEPTTNHIYPAKLSCFILFRPNAASKPMPLQRSHVLCTFHWRDHSRTSQSNGLGWGANIVCTSTRTWECATDRHPMTVVSRLLRCYVALIGWDFREMLRILRNILWASRHLREPPIVARPWNGPQQAAAGPGLHGRQALWILLGAVSLAILHSILHRARIASL